jgi:hypothetical protein
MMLKAVREVASFMARVVLGAGLRPLLSRRFLIVVSVVAGANLIYALVLFVNPLLLYLSGVFVLTYGFSLLLVDSAGAVDEKRKRASRRTLISLLVILLVSLALRCIGATSGFPLLVHADEWGVAENAATMIDRGSLDGGNYTHPNDISIYAGEILYPLVNKVLTREGFSESFAKNSTPFYLTSRLVSASAGVLLTAAAYLVGSLAAPAVGLIAAAIFAIFPPFVEHSHYATPDVLVTALLLFVILYCVRFLRNGGTRDLFLAIVFACLAVAEKYPAVLALPLVLAVVIFRGADRIGAVFTISPGTPLRERKAAVALFLVGLALVAVGAYSLRVPGFYDLPKAYITTVLHKPLPSDFAARTRMISKLVIAGGLLLAALGVFLRLLNGNKYALSAFVIVGAPLILFLVTPFMFINVGRVLYAFSHEARSTHLGADGFGYLGNLLFYAKDYVNAAGILSLLFMAIGTVFVFRERSLLPILFSFFYWICLSASGLHWSRWALPMHAGALLLVSLGLYRSWLFLEHRIRRGGALAVLAVLCAIPAASLFLGSVATSYQFALEDTRVAALRWCQAHGVDARNAVYDGYTPFKPSSADSADYPGPAEALYVVVSSDMYDRYLDEKGRYGSQAAKYEKIFQLPLLASFAPVKADASSSFELGNVAVQVRLLQKLGDSRDPVYSGPTIRIFRKTS